MVINVNGAIVVRMKFAIIELVIAKIKILKINFFEKFMFSSFL